MEKTCLSVSLAASIFLSSCKKEAGRNNQSSASLTGSYKDNITATTTIPPNIVTTNVIDDNVIPFFNQNWLHHVYELIVDSINHSYRLK